MARMDYVATHAYSGNANWDMQSINTIYQRSAIVIIVIVMVIIVIIIMVGIIVIIIIVIIVITVIIVIIIIGTCKESTLYQK